MSNINKQGRQVQRYANFGVDMMEWADGGYVKHSDYLALLDELEAVQKTSAARLGAIDTTHKMFQRERDRAEAAEKRTADLSHHLQCAHGFIEHTEAFGHEASNGILCCGDAQWNIDESKSALAAAGKGEAS
ncbi:hypothetical protein [Enterobacter kobei]|jgi:hypothetical protein|uniref:hypothetical protein n=1 Tax=Enterobacter kobei TaxID=208224 RepID=UPI0020048799|nr:hypothetical protein [Enterobacter kobei]MCK7020141.1 hypothetical protein [Enterobacter kobei]MCQ4372099.1 hypothetical protein [Enterobacter kobei]